MNVNKMFTTIDTHVAGEAIRIIVHSPIMLNEQSIELNQALIEEKYAREKALLLNEPRGHRGMNGCIVLPSNKADFACVFVHHERDVQFMYGGLVATVTALLETGNLAKHDNNVYQIETAGGVQSVYASFENQEVQTVLVESDACRIIETTEEYSLVEVDHARNYLIYEKPESILGIEMEYLAPIQKWGKQTTESLGKNGVSFAGIIMIDSADSHGSNVRSVTFERDGSILRSPGMDSTFSIFAALLDQSDTLTQLTNQSIFDSTLTARLIEGASCQFSIETQAFITGVHQFIYDQEDPLEHGFLLK
ncbi:proline racemase [Virgibacillus dakarensis]|uniref:Proline racemase n=1 Tax=Lentibacillus populi TaxID=1827502 RepID=A0A9W5TYB9_9BACI|nr:MULTISPECIES: proline racemase family protein [Bacillaceae]MBT2214897.1 proline racemase family protein [Virgibacillus dakarensis]MTW84506.1 proline racemase [Virgibacillus dakarensis]GGB42251.1 proline racemase [Lentibacillus populi]